MIKTFLVTADLNCAGRTHIFVNCPEEHLQAFIKKCGFGCSDCRNIQEVETISNEQADYVVTEKGVVFQKSYTL